MKRWKKQSLDYNNIVDIIFQNVEVWQLLLLGQRFPQRNDCNVPVLGNIYYLL